MPSTSQDVQYNLFALGSNGNYQLGTGDNEDHNQPVQVKVVHSESPSKSGIQSKPVQLVAGGNHTVILCSNWCAYSCGENHDGRLGNGSKHSENTMRMIDSIPSEPAAFDQVAATWSATIFTVRYHSRMISYGTGDNGELGCGPDVRSRDVAQCMESFVKGDMRIVQLASCMAHVVAVLSNGEVYGWGKGRKGQLGEPVDDVWTPRKIEGIPFPAVKAVCGKDFTCILGAPETGEFLVLGPSKNDRFGVKSNAPQNLRGWIDVQASWGSIYVLQESGQVFAWGRNDHGQLPPSNLPPVAKIAAGSEHCLALTRDGRVLAWGWGEHGNCGSEIDESGDVKGRWNELGISGKAIDVFAGCATSFIATVKQQYRATSASERSDG